jgi:predicted O-linked N-acetylglucosamine transferase (SPINDLY family)
MATESTDPILSSARDAHARGQLAHAVAQYEQVIAIQPDHAECLYLLGVALYQMGRHSEAVLRIRRAIAANPAVPEFHGDLAAILFASGDLPGAISAAENAVGLKPAFPQALLTLGNARCRNFQYEAGIHAYQRLLQIDSRAADAINNMAMALLQLGRFDQAIACFDQLLKLDPTDAAAHSNRIYASHFSASTTPAQIQEQLHRFNQLHALPLQPRFHTDAADRPLHIGYVSADFRDHVVGWNMRSWIHEHDRKNFKIHFYSNSLSGAADQDAVTRELRANVDVWRDINRLSDEEAAELIRQDQIDILVDLSLHTSGNRLLLFARKPAPVQVCYLAYPGSSGLAVMDYRLSDPYLDPPDQPLNCIEQTIRLPATYWCYQPGGPTPDVVDPPMLKTGVMTFGCLNQFQKVSQAALLLWRQILAAVPNSRLILHSPEGSHRQQINQLFRDGGVPASRIGFVGRLPWQQYIHLYQQIDIAFDPFPYAGGITTCDALWMGVPAIALAGDNAVARSGVSILKNAGLDDFIAMTPAQYLHIAASAANEPARFKQLRFELRDRLRASALMDRTRFARDIESAYRTMWAGRRQ